MKIKCPRCKSDLEVQAVGDFVACFHCSLEFTVDESQNFTESEPYTTPVLDNPPVLDIKPVSKPSSVLTMAVRTDEPNYVIVTDIRMKFSSMVEFMVMWVFASIPAIIILGLVFGLASIVISGFVRK